MRLPAPVLAAVLLAGCLQAAVAPADLGGSTTTAATAVAFEKIHAPGEIADALASYAGFPGLAVEEIGASGEGRPLHLVSVGTGPRVLWAVGRHHGNEPTGGEAILLVLRILAEPDATLPADAPPILRELAAHRDLVKERVTFVTIPVVNPDGAEAFTRGNGATPDPNRDYAAFHTVESQLVRDAFWSARPDVCLDLHNEGQSERFDFDAFIPIAFPEPEIQAALTQGAWLVVNEVDASGGFAGGPNENYDFALPDDTPPPITVVNPTAYHPGTHDMFCSMRGAPGWTPEGAIPGADEGGGNGGTHAAYAWSTRLHMVTLAAYLLDAAGLYDGLAPPIVRKADGVLAGPEAALTAQIPAPGKVTLQVVWQPPADPTLALLPVGVEFETPSGERLSGGIPTPGTYTSTVVVPAAAAGQHSALVQGPPGMTLQFRAYLEPRQEAPLRIERTATGLRVTNEGLRAIDARVSDVFDATPGAFTPAPDRVVAAAGTVAARTIVEWTMALAPGEQRDIAYPTAENVGPWRWTADDGASAATGVEGERSTR